ncbi:MAG: GrpB family protein [Cyanophyceae cyanobacterium]
MLGLERGKLKFIPHNPEWQKLFEEEKQRLQAAIGSDVLEIQHVGSTSIPGIIAKPILDIGIAVANFEAAAVCIKPMEKLGYSYRGENGIPRRHFFARGEPRTHHVHILEITSWDWQGHILFRDYLIQHPAVAQEYVQLKLKLLEQYGGDRDAYQVGKSSFIEQQALNQLKEKPMS